MPFLSVIIPAYNVERFLPKALESALRQTEADFELIVVNDGSTDGTGAVCDRYAARDARVRAIHQKNAGAHAARNAAIELATGEYLYFMDGDDWAEAGMFSAMRDIAERTRADLVILGFYIDTYHGEGAPSSQKKAHPDALYPDAASFRRAAAGLFDQNLLYPPWNKLFRASRVRAENIRFRPTMWDDFPFNLDYIRDVQTVAVDARAFYHFNRGLRASETSRYFPGMREKREEEHCALKELYEHWGMEADPGARELIARRYVERTFGVLENIACADSPLAPREKRAAMGEIIRSGEVRECLEGAKPRSFYMKLMLLVIATGNSGLTYLLARTISYAKAHCARVFTYLKAHR
jgi:glycosyltransferase EpsJ